MRYLIVLLLASCANVAVGPVISNGPDTFVVHGKDVGVGVGAEKVVSNLYRQASDYCQRKKLAMQETKMEWTAGGLASFPQARLEFRCVAR